MNARVAPCLAWGVMVLACGFAFAGEAFVQKLGGTEIGFKIVPIPAGTFQMGSPETEAGRIKNEGPRHEVKVEAFFMGEHEVTWGEYLQFLANYSRVANAKAPPIPKDKLADAVTFPTPIYEMDAGPELQRMGGRAANLPVVLISRHAAKQYTKWLSKKTGRFYRLPSEAEWEYAARAGTQTAFFFGDDPSKLGEYAWFKDNSKCEDGDPGYHPVMQKKPNPWGLYDIYGNVMEWCIDQYDADAYARAAKGATDPVAWPGMTPTPYPRVLRGGGYESEADRCRSAARMGSRPEFNTRDPQLPKSPHWLSDGHTIGFRVVSPVKEPSEAEKLKWWEADDTRTVETLKRDREQRELVTPGKVEK